MVRAPPALGLFPTVLLLLCISVYRTHTHTHRLALLGTCESRELIDLHMLRMLVAEAAIEGRVELAFVPRDQQPARPANVLVRLLVLADRGQLLDAMQKLHQIGAILLDQRGRQVVVLVDEFIGHEVDIGDGVAGEVGRPPEEGAQRRDHRRQPAHVRALGGGEVLVDGGVDETIAIVSQLLLHNLDAHTLGLVVAGQVVLASQVAQDGQALRELQVTFNVVWQLDCGKHTHTETHNQ